MRTFGSLGEFAAMAGQRLGESEWHTITQDRIDTFADATGDHQWIHVDPERAATGPFGSTIAHGYLTLSMLATFSQEIYRLEGVSSIVNYGLNGVRFPSPVPVGSEVRGCAELVSVEDAGVGTRCTVRFQVDVRGLSKPALDAETVLLVLEREPGSTGSDR